MNKARAQVAFSLLLLLTCGAIVGYAAIPQNTIRQNQGAVFPTLNATAGYFVGPNMIVSAARAATFATVDTGQGMNELYDMDQNVLTTSPVQFLSVNATNYYAGPNNVTDIFYFPESEASYIIFTRDVGGVPYYYAKNGTTGQIQFSGADASTVIQEAINGLGAIGGKILIKRGTYLINTEINVDLENVHIQGESVGWEPSPGKGTVLVANAVIPKMIDFTKSWGMLSNIAINGALKGAIGVDMQGADNYVFKASFFLCTDTNLKVSQHTWVTDSWIEGSSSYGILINKGSDYWILNNIFWDNNHADVGVDDADDVKIMGNRFAQQSDKGIEVFGTSNNHVYAFNKYYSKATYCIDLAGDTNYVRIFEEIANGNAATPNFLHTATAKTMVDVVVSECSLRGFTGLVFFEQGGAVTKRHNYGYITENSGSSSIPNASTSVVVAHGCSYTPDADDITITPIAATTNPPGLIYVDTIGAANFTVHCSADPGASGLAFNWAVRRTP